MSAYGNDLLQAAAFAESFAKEARLQAEGARSSIREAQRHLLASLDRLPVHQHPKGPRCVCGHDDFMHRGTHGAGECMAQRCDCSGFQLARE